MHMTTAPIVHVATGRMICMALTSAGEVWSWGRVGLSGLGPACVANHQSRNVVLPQPVLSLSKSHVVEIAIGRGLSCLRHKSGDVTLHGRDNENTKCAKCEVALRQEAGQVSFEGDMPQRKNWKSFLHSCGKISPSASTIIRSSPGRAGRTGGAPQVVAISTIGHRQFRDFYRDDRSLPGSLTRRDRNRLGTKIGRQL